MFDAGTQSNLRGAFEQVLSLAGSSMTWRQTKAPHASKTVVGYIRMVGKDEIELINAYGMNAKILTLAAKDFTVKPEKFDTFVVGADKYTASAIQDVMLNNAVAFYKVYLRGQDR